MLEDIGLVACASVVDAQRIVAFIATFRSARNVALWKTDARVFFASRVAKTRHFVL
jgi:hypothetical protein